MLHGDRVALRALEPADAGTMLRWYQDHEFSTRDGNIYGTSRESLEAFLRTLTSPSFRDVSLGITIDGGTLIGIIRLKRTSPEDRHADLGIAIERAHWSEGYGTDATRTILRFAFEEMNLHRVSLGVDDDNMRARRCYEKCSFVEEGILRQARYRNGRWHDLIMMAILKDERRSRR